MKSCILWLACWLLATASRAEVRVFAQASNGWAWVHYECTAGEVVRAFALDVSVDRGQVVGISDFLRGESQPGRRGYGIFPAAFRIQLAVISGTNVNWDASGYTPLADATDAPDDTLPGLNSSGVTLELAALWDSTMPTAAPDPAGTLCALHLSAAAQVSVAANGSRGGVVVAGDVSVTPVFAGAWVDPAGGDPSIQIALMDGTATIHFQGGELEMATSVAGPWTGTGNASGQFTEPVAMTPTKFYRVQPR